MSGDPGEALALILLNYRRPQNIGRIARSVLDAIPGVSVFILDQADTDGLRARDDIPWGRVWYRRADFNGRAEARVRLASELPFRYFMALDDDIFPDARQIRALFEAVRRQPQCAHGLYSKLLFKDRSGVIRISAGGCRQGPASMIHMAYAFDKAHVDRTLALAAEMGFPRWEDVRFGDDILLSVAGSTPAVSHDLGPLRVCTTQLQEGVALQTESDFNDTRAEILFWLIKRKRILVVQAKEGGPADPGADGVGDHSTERPKR